MTDVSEKSYVCEKLSEAALYEQLAEECVELSHACLKKARKLRGENPTPIEMDEIDNSVEEEFTDVSLVSTLLDIHPNLHMYWEKYDRWCQRLGRFS